MQLLTLLQKGVVLGQALQRQLVINLDVLGLRNVALLEIADFDWVSRTKKTNLATGRHQFKDVLDYVLELSRNESVDLVKDDKIALV